MCPSIKGLWGARRTNKMSVRVFPVMCQAQGGQCVLNNFNKMKENKIDVAILGCTGAVGQKLVSLLGDHPLFNIRELVASDRSAGQRYSDRVVWKEPARIPEGVGDIVIRRLSDKLESRLLFSGLDAAVAGEAESDYASRGHIVVSNSRNHRMDTYVPLVIPEINASHLDIVKMQDTYGKSGGFIVTNPNCSTIVLALAIYPVFAGFGLEKVMAVTMQAISGGGYPGVPSMDILGNIIPYIGGEEEKIERELSKIFGTCGNDGIVPADFAVSATCNRVPVRDGHTVCISFSTKKKAGKEGLLDAMEHCYPDLGLYSSPDKVLEYNNCDDRPQPLMDLQAGHGMTVTAGRLRPCNILDWKMTAFGHNTVRGAAGAAVLNAELLVRKGFLK